MGRMKRSWLVLVAAVALVGACTSTPGGDREACTEFTRSADLVLELMDAVNRGDTTANESYRTATAEHADRLRDAADHAESADLRENLQEAAALWDADEVTAYYLAEESLRESCG